MLLIARLHARGRSLRTIARIVTVASGQAVSANTIGRWLRRALQPQEEVQQALASLRAQAVEGCGQAILRGARDGRHAPAKDLLVAAGTIERDAPTERLVILVGDGKTAVGMLPQPDGPIIEAEPVQSLPKPLS